MIYIIQLLLMNFEDLEVYININQRSIYLGWINLLILLQK